MSKKILTVGALLMAAASPAALSQEQKPMLTSVTSTSAVFWLNFVWQKGGFLERSNVKTELLVVSDVASQIAQVVGGSLNISYTVCESAVKAIDKGAPIAIIASTMQKFPYSIWGTKSIKSAKDLNGKLVVMGSANDFSTAIFDKWVKEGGGDPRAVDRRFDIYTGNRYAAVLNGSAAATILTQPFDFRAQADGMNLLFEYSKSIEEIAFICAVGRRDWLKERSADVKAHLSSMVAATAWFYDPKNREAVIDMQVGASKQDKALIAKTYDYYMTSLREPFSHSMKVSPKAIGNLVGILLEASQIKAGSTADMFIDMSYLPQ